MMRVSGKLAKAAIVLVAVLLILALILGSIWVWALLSEYVDPNTPTQRKDLVNVFVLIVASVVVS